VGRPALLKKDEPKPSHGEDNLDRPSNDLPSTTGDERGVRTAIVEAVPRVALGVAALFALRKLVRR
jgi:hypothetical protein